MLSKNALKSETEKDISMRSRGRQRGLTSWVTEKEYFRNRLHLVCFLIVNKFLRVEQERVLETDTTFVFQKYKN
jgi:hypothetical protein